MKVEVDPDKLVEDGGTPERGYDAWKRAKIVRALVQSEDRSAMIPADRLIRELGI